jgi:hypothetical protein
MADSLEEIESYSADIPLKFAEDFSDPSLDTVLQWHIRNCQHCSQGVTEVPPRFGVSAWSRYCAEYWEIVQDYAEYDGHYAMRGNP